MNAIWILFRRKGKTITLEWRWWSKESRLIRVALSIKDNNSDLLSSGSYRIPFFTPEELVEVAYRFFFDSTPSTIILYQLGYLLPGKNIDTRINISSNHIFTPKSRIQ